ncbi:MAG: prepilin-type N-terminal cleavage/methylation domain-containing protein [Gammaproteobacteria bacterium]|nr:prepilin-type N-terminal cleavage/methylation domain-containing protein [Gammaproteobacteria bacterium]
MNADQGFTMIELLIVVAIIGILVSIGIPSYKHYIERARFSEVMMAAAPYKTAVSLGLQEGTPLEDLNTGQNGIPKAPKSTKNLERIAVDHGVVTATATKIAGSYTYILTPDEDGAHWSISGSCVEAGICKE